MLLHVYIVQKISIFIFIHVFLKNYQNNSFINSQIKIELPKKI
jgi:hypothetical protein